VAFTYYFDFVLGGSHEHPTVVSGVVQPLTVQKEDLNVKIAAPEPRGIVREGKRGKGKKRKIKGGAASAPKRHALS